MYNIGIIMGGVMPVPAVCGGAIETLIESVAKQHSKNDKFRLTIFSVYHKKAVEAAKRYPDVRFVWTHTNTFWNLYKHAVFMAVRQLTGKTIRVLQRHYNEIAPVIQSEKFDLLIVEGGDEKAVLDIAKDYRREQLVFHAHVHFIPKEETVNGYGHMIGVSEFVVREYEKACQMPVHTHLLKNAIDTSTFKGKRDKAALLLATRLGIRTCDILNLKEENLNFDNNTITFIQVKTYTEITLPMVDDVRMALVDYLEERNKMSVTIDNIFVAVKGQNLKPLHRSALRFALTSYFDKAGVDYKGKKHGLHVLRSSLASSMVNDNVSYDIVRKVLGHTDDDSIKHYARIDIEELRKCAIEVPAPSGKFKKFLEDGAR